MKALFQKIHAALSLGEGVVLMSIIASSGSTPRGSGAKMALFENGDTVGTIGGGAVEYESLKLARQALVSRRAFTHGFSLTHNETADIGMICGGEVTVYFQYLAGLDAARLVARILESFDSHVRSWLITRITDGTVRSMAVYAAGELYPEDAFSTSDVLPLLKPRAVLRTGDVTYYAEPLSTPETVYVFGGGHVSKELVPVLAHVGFSCVVFEDRPQFADISLFPGVLRTLEGDFTNIARDISVTGDDYCVIMTRGHEYDYELLAQVLRTDAVYIGVIGSRRKIAATNARLIEAGLPEAELSRIHTPIGLPIGAQTPAEIAISIAAELIGVRAGLLKEDA